MLSILALDDSTNTSVLSFGVRFPATVDSSTIEASDFEAVVTPITTSNNTALSASDISFSPVSGSLDYWQVTLNVDSAAVSAGRAGEVRLAFASTADIQSSTGKSFDLAEFNTSAPVSTDPLRSTSYQLDYNSPAITSIDRFTPSLANTNSHSVTFQLSFSKELNTSINSSSGLRRHRIRRSPRRLLLSSRYCRHQRSHLWRRRSQPFVTRRWHRSQC